MVIFFLFLFLGTFRSHFDFDRAKAVKIDYGVDIYSDNRSTIEVIDSGLVSINGN